MKIEVLRKEYDLPEELLTILKVNKIMKDKKTGELYKSIVILDEVSTKIANKWLNNLKWDINVRQDSYSRVRGYQVEAQRKKMALTKELRNVERFLIDIYKNVDNKDFENVIVPLIALERYDLGGVYIIITSNYLRKYMKEVSIDESSINK